MLRYRASLWVRKFQRCGVDATGEDRLKVLTSAAVGGAWNESPWRTRLLVWVGDEVRDVSSGISDFYSVDLNPESVVIWSRHVPADQMFNSPSCHPSWLELWVTKTFDWTLLESVFSLFYLFKWHTVGFKRGVHSHCRICCVTCVSLEVNTFIFFIQTNYICLDV